VYLFEGGKNLTACCGGGWQSERDAVDLIASSHVIEVKSASTSPYGWEDSTSAFDDDEKTFAYQG